MNFRTIKILGSEWMLENLNTTKGLIEEYDYFFPKNDKTLSSRGLFYKYSATQKLLTDFAKDGWRIPSVDDYKTLVRKFSFEQINDLLKIVPNGCIDSITGATNLYNSYSYLWADNINKPAVFVMKFTNKKTDIFSATKNNAFNIRLVR